jgi:hypothetical protein
MLNSNSLGKSTVIFFFSDITVLFKLYTANIMQKYLLRKIIKNIVESLEILFSLFTFAYHLNTNENEK